MEEGGWGRSVFGEGVEVCRGGVPMLRVAVDRFTFCTENKLWFIYN